MYMYDTLKAMYAAHTRTPQSNVHMYIPQWMIYSHEEEGSYMFINIATGIAEDTRTSISTCI